MKKILSLIIIGFCINAYADQDQATSLLGDSTTQGTQNTNGKPSTGPRLIIVKPEPSTTTPTQTSTIQNKKDTAKKTAKTKGEPKSKVKKGKNKSKEKPHTGKSKKTTNKSQSHKATHKAKKKSTVKKTKKKAQ